MISIARAVFRSPAQVVIIHLQIEAQRAKLVVAEARV
jgi:hypothetical protein